MAWILPPPRMTRTKAPTSVTRLNWQLILVDAAAIVESYDPPVTLRQLFYRLVAAGVIPNTSTAYKTLSSRTAAARRAPGSGETVLGEIIEEDDVRDRRTGRVLAPWCLDCLSRMDARFCTMSNPENADECLARKWLESQGYTNIKRLCLDPPDYEDRLASYFHGSRRLALDERHSLSRLADENQKEKAQCASSAVAPALRVTLAARCGSRCRFRAGRVPSGPSRRTRMHHQS